MRISFFETNNGMDIRAVQGGVYMVELKSIKTEKKICLYIGESAWIASRCGVHLFSLYTDPNYFGLTHDDLWNEDFILIFSIIEAIDEKKSVLGNGKYKERELEAIKNHGPLTQLDTSDRQIRDVETKRSRVQKALKKYGFK